MSEIKNLQPTAVWKNFDLLTQVPRPSGHLDKVQKFLLDWAKEHNIEASLDGAGNVIMYKPATKGYENKKMVTLQGHMDMVPQKSASSSHDFLNDPIQTWIDGEWVRAKETTLGADDGMAVATIMGIFEDDSIEHGPLEGLITSDEETTMYGVEHLEAGLLKGDILLNLDHEEEGEMVIGSAGGVNQNASLEYKPEPTTEGDVAVRVAINGLLGGHSGLEINEGRANANKLLGRLVQDAIVNFEARLCEWHGGNMRNAIPRYAEAILALPEGEVEELKKVCLEEWQTVFKDEYRTVEKDLTVEFEVGKLPAEQVPEEIQDNLIGAICGCHNGVMRMIPEVPTIVETSSNLGIINIAGGKADIVVLIRSSRDSMRQCCADTIESVLNMAGMKVTYDHQYPAWQPNPSSEIVEVMKKVYKDRFGVDNLVQVVHAGLECGVIGAKYQHMDMVSFGPTLRSPHTPNERCFIPSVQKYWDFVLDTLKQVPEK